MGGRRLTVRREVGIWQERHVAYLEENARTAVENGTVTLSVPSSVVEESLHLTAPGAEAVSYTVSDVKAKGTPASVFTASGHEEIGNLVGRSSDGIALQQGEDVLFFTSPTDVEIVEEARGESEQYRDVQFSLTTEAEEIEASLSYSIEDLSWTAHYSVVVDVEHDRYDFVGKYCVTNNCGKDLEDCDVELLVCRVVDEKVKKQRRIRKRKSGKGLKKKQASTALASTPIEVEHQYGTGVCKDFWERGGVEMAYRLSKTITLRNGHSTSVTFTQGVIEPINKHHFIRFTVPGDRSGLVEKEEGILHVTGEAVLEIQNLKEHGLGMALPQGELRVYRSGDTVREASVGCMPSTSADEVIRILVGNENGLTAKREVLSYTKSENKRTISEKIQLTISNISLSPVTVLVEDTLYRWHNWKVVEVEPVFHPNGTDKIRWVLPDLPVDAEETIIYTVVYSWDVTAQPMPLPLPALQ